MTLELSRRGMLCSLASAAAAGVARKTAAAAPAHHAAPAGPGPGAAFMAGLRGTTVDPKVNGFDPHTVLRDFDRGTARRLASGRVLRTWDIEATERSIELAPG